MQRMTGIDPMFIYSDTPDTPMEVAYACVFDPSTAEEGYSFERVCDVLNERLPNLAPFRRRLMTVPLGLDHPRWVDDPDFDLGNHLFRVALPAPGGPGAVHRNGGQGDEPLARSGSAAVGDACHRGAGRRPGGPHRQGAPLGGRRRGWRRAHGAVARSEPRGALGGRGLQAVDPGPAAVAGPSGGRRPAQRVHPPHPYLAGGTRDRSDGGAHGALRHERRQRTGDDSGRRTPSVRHPAGAAA